MSSDYLVSFSVTAQSRPSVHIALLGGFDLVVDDVPVTVQVGSKRLLAFIALNYRVSVPRALIAGSLWPEASEQKAHTNLRAALTRLHDLGRKALDVSPSEVRLAQAVTVDLYHARSLAQGILDPRVPAEDLGLNPATVDHLSADLLPGWYDEWVMLEAEKWRELRLHALERLAGEFIDAEQFAGAVTAAHTAVQADPLRESSQASLIRAHLAEGNLAEALDHFERYSRRLRNELGLRPTKRLRQLVAGLQQPPPGGRR